MCLPSFSSFSALQQGNTTHYQSVLASLIHPYVSHYCIYNNVRCGLVQNKREFSYLADESDLSQRGKTRVLHFMCKTMGTPVTHWHISCIGY